MKLFSLVSTLLLTVASFAQHPELEKAAFYHQLCPGFTFGASTIPFDSLGIDRADWMDYFDWEGDDIYESIDSVSWDELYDFCSHHMAYYFTLARDKGNIRKADLLAFADAAEYWQVWSEDSLILNLLLEEGHGGTYRSQISHLFLFEGDRIAKFYIDPDWDDEFRDNQDGHAFAPDGYYEISLLPDGNYLALGAVRGCSSCFGTYAEVWKGSDDLEISWSQSFFGRDYESVFEFFPDSSLLKISYVTDDLQPVCSCEGEQESEYDFDWDKLRACFCVYQYKEEGFELILQSDKPAKIGE